MNPKLYLHYISKHATGMYGALMDGDGLPFAVSLQPNDKWLNPGEYTCTPRMYHKGNYMTFEIKVEGHSDVLFHKGNHQEDSKLCVLIAENFELVDGVPGIADSKHGFNEFWTKYGNFSEFKLIVSAKEGVI